MGGLGDVVVADDTDVLRDPAARLVQGAQHAEGHLVVGHEDRGDGRVLRQFAAQVVARVRAPVAEDRGVHLCSGRLEGGAPALRPAVRRGPARRARQVVDRGVAEGQEVPCGLAGAGAGVRGDHRGAVTQVVVHDDQGVSRWASASARATRTWGAIAITPSAPSADSRSAARTTVSRSAVSSAIELTR